MTTLNGQQALAQLWAAAALDPSALERAQLPTGPAPLPSSFAVGALAQASIGASALMAAEFWRLRGGAAQTVTVDLAHAAAEFRSERYLRVDGAPAPELWDAIAGPYRCGDGRWVRIHTNFPHHRDGILRLLGCRHDKDSVAAALQGWRAFEFEQAVAERGLVATAMRSFNEWDRHPQGQAVAALPLFDIERIGDAPPLARPFAPRPLQGIRVLDLTRIIAGPVGGRVLAAHGADVLRVTSPRLPSIPPLDIDTGRGKRNAELDLRQAADGEQLRRLLAEADVFIQGYRPGGLAALGFGPEQAARLRPGIVYASLSAYGHTGPWAGRRGFDSLVQTASGFNHAEAKAFDDERPRALPAQALDHAAGYLLAFGVIAALARQAQEGGSWQVRVSLAQTGHWLRQLGADSAGCAAADPGLEQIAPWLADYPSGFGALRAVRHAAQLSLTPAHWVLPSTPLGSHAAEWLPR